jgi:Alpha galactosidase A/Alpha galactosidase C-terminal beta sandwich domain
MTYRTRRRPRGAPSAVAVRGWLLALLFVSPRAARLAVAGRGPLSASLLALLLSSTVALAPAAAGANAAPELSWTAPAPADGAGQQPTAVDCPLESLCVGVDGGGHVLSTTDPTDTAPAWEVVSIDAGQKLSSVSCIAGALCVAVDDRGEAFVSTNPTGGAAAWASRTIDAGRELTGVSCPTTTLCVAVDAAGAALASTDPANGAWASAVDIAGATALSGVSCASTALCVAAADDGSVLVSKEPASGVSGWGRRQVDLAAGPLAVSCGSGGVCLAVDQAGGAAASGDPTAATPTWSTTEIDPGRALSAASCAPPGQCVVVDSSGNALASEAPAQAPPAWSARNVDTTALVGVSCKAVAFCLALDAAGRSLSARLPAPIVPVPPPPRPRPAIVGTPAPGSPLTCEPGMPAGAAVQLSYAWLRETEPIAGASGSAYTITAGDEGHHLQCRVTAANAAGSTTATSAFVTVPFQGLPEARGETMVGRARAHDSKVTVLVACSSRALHGCNILLRLTRTGIGHAATLASRRAHLGRRARRNVTVGLGAHGRRLLAHRRRLAVTLLVSGTVIASIEAPLAKQRLVLARARAAGRARAQRARVAALPAGRARAQARVAALPGPPSSARALLAATPYMGWDSYFAFGPRYSESTVLEQASDLLKRGLARRGYRFVWLDVGWWQGQRAADGRIALDRSQWPHGIAWLAAVLHHAGLLLGLYTDAGADGCGGVGQGSYGRYRQDAATFAAWGVDAVKVDFCGGSRLGLDPARAYRAFRTELDASGRKMLLSICDFLQPGEQGEGSPSVGESAFTSYTFGPEVGNSWRTDGDVGVPGQVPFGKVLRNLDADAAHPQAAGPGHWNDPDYLGPDQGMGVQQFRTQLSIWAMLAAPLMVSGDLGRLSRASLAALGNREVVAIDQDPLGAQGTLLASEGAGQVWVKPLADGSRAVALLNRGPAPLWIGTSAVALGLPAARAYAVRDLWRHSTSSAAGAIGAQVGGYTTVLLRVSAGFG